MYSSQCLATELDRFRFDIPLPEHDHTGPNSWTPSVHKLSTTLIFPRNSEFYPSRLVGGRPALLVRSLDASGPSLHYEVHRGEAVHDRFLGLWMLKWRSRELKPADRLAKDASTDFCPFSGRLCFYTQREAFDLGYEEEMHPHLVVDVQVVDLWPPPN